ncbi:unnamed protein product [Paramecium primaurelia]|uniref:Uncharacterized protein n=1 Tax=Paramecium primaurelia TaxID=5886 RepID=A0A8S1MU03_PARPR|nr:unnamed protein product [Paramecium primaurelia]
MVIESEVLQTLYELYQRNLISYEQKGMIKDMLISKDVMFLSCIRECDSQFSLQDKIMELLKEQESPLNITSTSPIKRIQYCQFSRQRFRSVIQNYNKNNTSNRFRSNSLVTS